MFKPIVPPHMLRVNTRSVLFYLKAFTKPLRVLYARLLKNAKKGEAC